MALVLKLLGQAAQWRYGYSTESSELTNTWRLAIKYASLNCAARLQLPFTFTDTLWFLMISLK